MTITLEDIAQNSKPAIARYSKEASEVSYNLSKMRTNVRALLLERIIAQKLANHTGYRCKALSGREPWDVSLWTKEAEVAGRRHPDIKIEVKSSLRRVTQSTRGDNRENFSFVSIKPDKFDYLFIIFVGEHETVEKWCEATDIKKYFEHKDYNKGDGVNLSCKLDAIPDFFRDLKDFPQDPKATMLQCTNDFDVMLELLAMYLPTKSSPFPEHRDLPTIIDLIKATVKVGWESKRSLIRIHNIINKFDTVSGFDLRIKLHETKWGAELVPSDLAEKQAIACIRSKTNGEILRDPDHPRHEEVKAEYKDMKRRGFF